MTYTSSIRRNNVTESHLVGVRPVIELPKSFIDNPIRPNVADWTDEDSNWLITANKNIYTVYTPVRYSISYNLNGGSCSSCSTTQYNILTNTFSLPQNPTKSGATFLGWTGTNGNEPQKVVSITKGSTGNRSYTANWAHTKTIMLNSNCSTNLTNIYTTVTYKSTSNNVVPTSMTCSGKVFDGFWTSTTGGTRVYNADGHYNSEATTYWASDGTWNVNNSTSETLYAHWLPAITVTLDYNDGETANSTISVGQGQTYWRLPTPTRTGYEFNGWVNGVWVPDKTLAAWVASLADNAFVTANFKPNTTYTIEYDVTLNEPIPSGYTASQTGQWGGIGFKKDSTYTVANGKLYNLATPNYVVGQKYHVINTITTPADLSNVSMVFYTARSTNSSSQGYTINGTFSDIVFYESKIDTSTTVTQSSAHTLKAVWEPYKPYALGELVRYNPVNNQKCTGGTTCYKWRAIVANDTSSNANITLQMDYNLVNSVAWASKADYNDDPNYGSTGNNNKGPITALKALETATASWDNSLKLNYTYDVSLAPSNYGSLSCTSGTCTAAGNTITTNLKARMITAEEMRAITLAAGAATGTNADNWNQTNGAWYYFSNTEYIIGRQTSASNSSGSTVLSWLIENTTVDSTSGATNNTYGDNNTGYWTLTPGTVCADCAHRIAKTGRIYNDGGVSYDTTAGVRPVITIPKSIFE